MTKDQLLAEAKSLEPGDRELLADEILRSITDSDQDALDAEWLAEIHRRNAAYDAGEMKASPVDEVIARLLAKARR